MKMILFKTALLGLLLSTSALANPLIYVGNSYPYQYQITVIDGATNKVLPRPVYVSGPVVALVAHPNGRTVYASLGINAIAVIDTKTQLQTAIVPVATGPGSLAISPDGKRL